MADINVRLCTDDDVPLLARLNSELIEDEQYDKKYSVPELQDRMLHLINSDYAAYLFEARGQVVGYALVKFTVEPLYLRQFFICRECRRLGYGAAAFHALMQTLRADALDIEVLTWNDRGLKFWRSLGFQERSIYMRYSEEA